MKKHIIILLCIMFTCLQGLSSQERFGGGIIIGGPTALSFQIRYPSANSLDFLVATNVKENFFIQDHYDFKIGTVAEDNEGIYSINLYAGPGLFLKSTQGNKSVIGASGNIGFSWLFKKRYDFFLEYSPKISFTPLAKLDLTGGFGFRCLF